MNISAKVCLAYYAFDGNANDGSTFLRDGLNNGVKFDSIGARKNLSAVFDGSSYITVRPFQNVQYGNLVINTTINKFATVSSETIALLCLTLSVLSPLFGTCWLAGKGLMRFFLCNLC